MRVAVWLAPSIAIAVLGALGGALAEGFVHAGSTAVAAVGAGEASVVVVPLVAVVLSIARGLMASWRPFLARDRGAGVLAAIAYGLGALAAVFVAAYLATRFGARTTRVPWIAAGIAAAGAAGAVIAAVALAPPVVRGLAAVVARAWPRITVRAAILCGAAVIAAGALLAWRAARPILAQYDLGLFSYGAGFLAGAAIAAVAVRRWHARRAWFTAGALGAWLGAWLAGRVLAADLPRLLDAWHQLPLAGRVIDLRRDIGGLRGEVLAAIPAPVARTAQHPDVVFITVDALRADRLTAQHMPQLHAFAAEAVTFARAFAPSSVTRGSVPSILTALSPGQIRGRLIGFSIKLDPRHVLFAEQLQRAGYTTRGYLCCAQHFGGPFELGLDRGLQETVFDPDAADLVHAAMTYLADPALDGAPRFAWLHPYETHMWSQRYDRALYGAAAAPRYDRAAAELDRILGTLIAAIRARGRPTIIVLTSDHGEGLGEHGALFHAALPYASQIHVPLVIAAPGVPARRIETAVGLTTIAPTVLELAGFLPAQPGFAHLLGGEPRAGDGEAYSLVQRDRSIGFTAHSLVAGDLHLIEIAGQPPELYDLRADPGELVDLAAREPAKLADMRRRLAAHRARDATPPF